jgi:hypothetical protein
VEKIFQKAGCLPFDQRVEEKERLFSDEKAKSG